MIAKNSRGDTIVEVVLAFGVFAMLAVGTTVVMNRGLSMGQQSLERTLVRQQVDAQAELLRFARDTNSPAWQSVKSTANLALPTEVNTDTFDECPDRPLSRSFVMNIAGTGENAQVVRTALTPSNFSASGYHSKAVLNIPTSGTGEVFAEGIWVQAVEITSGGAGAGRAYDMYIRACWDSVGSVRPLHVSTIVRLYDS